jgi:endonuclease/exonuclease/phosphatase family metal-dependent hydrolase
MIHGTYIVNIYAPSGAENKRDRETFYTSEVPWLLPTMESALIVVGDFNCVLEKADSTGQGNWSRALEQLVHGYHLTDVWDSRTANRGYTYYTTGASRLDRIYVSRTLRAQKRGRSSRGSFH